MRTFLTNALAAGPNIQLGIEQEQQRQRSRIQTQAEQLGLDKSRFEFDELQQMQPYRYRQKVAGVESAELLAKQAQLDYNLSQEFSRRDRELTQENISTSIDRNRADINRLEQQILQSEELHPLQKKRAINELALVRHKLNIAQEFDRRQAEALLRQTNAQIDNVLQLIEESKQRVEQSAERFPVDLERALNDLNIAREFSRPQAQAQLDETNARLASAYQLMAETGQRMGQSAQRFPVELGASQLRLDEAEEALRGRRQQRRDLEAFRRTPLNLGAPINSMIQGQPGAALIRQAPGTEAEQEAPVVDDQAGLLLRPDMPRSEFLAAIGADDPRTYIAGPSYSSPRAEESRFQTLLNSPPDPPPPTEPDDDTSPRRFEREQQRTARAAQGRAVAVVNGIEDIVSFIATDINNFATSRLRNLGYVNRAEPQEILEAITNNREAFENYLAERSELSEEFSSIVDDYISAWGPSDEQYANVLSHIRDFVNTVPAAPTEAAPTEAATIEEAVDKGDVEEVVEAVEREFEATSPTDKTIEEIIYKQDDFFLGNPQFITPQMQHAMNVRERLVSIAEMKQRFGTPENLPAISALLLQIEQIDMSMLSLMGSQAVLELSQFRDPRRMDGVLSYMNGVQTQTIPRTDGRYDMFVNERLILEGASSEELVSMFTMQYDTNAQARYADLQMRIQEASIKGFEAGEIKRSELQAELENRVLRYAMGIDEIDAALARAELGPNVTVSKNEGFYAGEPSHFITSVDPTTRSVIETLEIIPQHIDANDILQPTRVQNVSVGLLR